MSTHVVCPTVMLWCLGAAGQLSSAEDGDQWHDLIQQADRLETDRHYNEAAEAAKQAAVLAKTVDAEDVRNFRQAFSQLVLGNIYRDWGHCPESRAGYSQAIAFWRHFPDPPSKLLFLAELRYIAELLECGDSAAAEEFYRAHANDLKRLRSRPADDTKILGLRAAIALRQRRYAVAEQLARLALEGAEHIPNPDAGDLAGFHSMVAAALQKQGKYEAALAEAQPAIRSYEAIDPQNPSLIDPLNTSACALFALDRAKEAAQNYQRALDLAIRAFGEDSRFTAILRMHFATVLRKADRAVEADAMEQKGRDTYRRLSIQDNQTVNAGELGFRK